MGRSCFPWDIYQLKAEETLAWIGSPLGPSPSESRGTEIATFPWVQRGVRWYLIWEILETRWCIEFGSSVILSTYDRCIKCFVYLIRYSDFVSTFCLFSFVYFLKYANPLATTIFFPTTLYYKYFLKLQAIFCKFLLVLFSCARLQFIHGTDYHQLFKIIYSTLDNTSLKLFHAQSAMYCNEWMKTFQPAIVSSFTVLSNL